MKIDAGRKENTKIYASTVVCAVGILVDHILDQEWCLAST
jgi:hypothetical protein